jgi:RNA polymerase sigma-70 factor (ECF subfamily)
VAEAKRDEEWATLMRAALAGDGNAYHRLLQSLSNALRAAARGGFARAGVAPNDLEDVIQETLLAIHLKRHTWDPSQPLGPWVRAIAKHKLIDTLRRRGRRIEIPIDTLLDTLAAEEQVQSDLDRADAARLVDGLNGRQKSIVRAISLEGQSIREVAEKMGMNEGAVRVALHRGLKSLATMYRKNHVE